MWVWFSCVIVLTYLKVFNRTRMEGLENIPSEGPVLVLSNHISDLDPALIPAAILVRCPTQLVRAVSKVELFHVPILGPIIRSYGAIPVNRTGRDIRGMREIIKAMEQEKVLIFPEGTRSMDGKLLPGKRPVGRFIQLVKPVIVPAAVWGTILAVPPSSATPRICKDIGVRFGPPLDMEELYQLPATKENSQVVIDHVMAAIGRMVEDLKAEGRVVEI
ncbi:MAG: lysophospholipid acyltransferase family protein [Nitrospinota bacterium]